MALDTTIGAITSDSYISLTDLRDYWTARNVDLSGVADATLEAASRKAAQWIDQTHRFFGIKQYQFQARAWPRLTTHLVDGWPIYPDAIPQDIQNAQAEMAYLIYQGANPFATVEGGAVVRKRDAAGPVSTEVEYTNFREIPRYVAVEGLLARYTTMGGSQVKMVRA